MLYFSQVPLHDLFSRFRQYFTVCYITIYRTVSIKTLHISPSVGCYEVSIIPSLDTTDLISTGPQCFVDKTYLATVSMYRFFCSCAFKMNDLIAPPPHPHKPSSNIPIPRNPKNAVLAGLCSRIADYVSAFPSNEVNM